MDPRLEIANTYNGLSFSLPQSGYSVRPQKDASPSMPSNGFSASSTTATPNRATALFASSVLQQNVLRSNSYVESARTQYSLVINSTDQAPAVIHKLRDSVSTTWDQQASGCSWEAMKKTGRVYSPSAHCWDTNGVWMLAHIHKHNQFMVVSPVTTANIVRSQSSVKYSAFAREIATAMNAGYEVTKIEYQYSKEIIYLSPTKTPEDSLKITINDCRTDTESCKRGIEKFSNSLESYKKSKTTTTPMPMVDRIIQPLQSPYITPPQPSFVPQAASYRPAQSQKTDAYQYLKLMEYLAQQATSKAGSLFTKAGLYLNQAQKTTPDKTPSKLELSDVIYIIKILIDQLNGVQAQLKEKQSNSYFISLSCDYSEESPAYQKLTKIISILTKSIDKLDDNSQKTDDDGEIRYFKNYFNLYSSIDVPLEEKLKNIASTVKPLIAQLQEIYTQMASEQRYIKITFTQEEPTEKLKIIISILKELIKKLSNDYGISIEDAKRKIFIDFASSMSDEESQSKKKSKGTSYLLQRLLEKSSDDSMSSSFGETSSNKDLLKQLLISQGAEVIDQLLSSTALSSKDLAGDSSTSPGLLLGAIGVFGIIASKLKNKTPNKSSYEKLSLENKNNSYLNQYSM